MNHHKSPCETFRCMTWFHNCKANEQTLLFFFSGFAMGLSVSSGSCSGIPRSGWQMVLRPRLCCKKLSWAIGWEAPAWRERTSWKAERIVPGWDKGCLGVRLVHSVALEPRVRDRSSALLNLCPSFCWPGGFRSSVESLEIFTCNFFSPTLFSATSA